jgi:putative endonuclease
MDARYFVYVLQNSDARYYVGLTDDVMRRVGQHNEGVSRWTRGKGPWHLVWKHGPLTLSAARKLESELKRQKGGDGFFRVTGLQCS